MGALALLLICSGDLPREQCTTETARAVVSVRLDQIACGVGTIAAPYRLNIGADEFVRVICRMR